MKAYFQTMSYSCWLMKKHRITLSNNPTFRTGNTNLLTGILMTTLRAKSWRNLKKKDIPHLQEALRIPEIIQFYKGSFCCGLEALYIILWRLAFRICFYDIVSRFGRSVPDLCKITHCVMNHIYYNHRHRIQNWFHPFLLPASLVEYASAIHKKGASLSSSFGFVDGTVRPICKPGKNQKALFNRHKWVHSLRFQCVALPNKLTANLLGPFGR